MHLLWVEAIQLQSVIEGLLECLQERSLTRRYTVDLVSHHPMVSLVCEGIEVGTPIAAVNHSDVTCFQEPVIKLKTITSQSQAW